jgi:hypothetical protein
MCSGVCANLTNDGANCGACGHSCRGYTCSNNACVPVALTGASGQASDVTNNGTFVFYSDATGSQPNGAIIRVPLTGTCPPSCNTQLLGSLTFPSTISINPAGDRLYWLQEASGGTPEQLASMNIDGTGLTTVATNLFLGNATGLAVDASFVYYANIQNGGIARCPVGSSCTQSGQTTVSTHFAMRLALDASYVYFTDFGPDVFRCTLPACTTAGLTTLVQGSSNTEGIFVDSTSLYWTARHSNNSDGTVIRSDKTTGATITTYTTTAKWPYAVTSDGTNVYWTEAFGSAVYECPIAGCPNGVPIKIGTSGEPQGITLDKYFVYWGDYGGVVYKVAK